MKEEQGEEELEKREEEEEREKEVVKKVEEELKPWIPLVWPLNRRSRHVPWT